MLSTATILEAIEDRIRERGLSQAQFNRMAFGSDQTTAIQNLKNGSFPRADRLEAMAKVLDLEFYFGPKRVSEPTVIQTTNTDFVLVPMYDAALAAGAGAQNGDNGPISELAFHRKWLRAIGLSPGKACVARATGESMQPTISAGDMLLIDLARTDIPVRRTVPNIASRPPIYALQIEGEARVKRIARPDRDTIILLSDNQAHLPEVLTGARAAALAPTIIGQVRWSGHTVTD